MLTPHGCLHNLPQGNCEMRSLLPGHTVRAQYVLFDDDDDDDDDGGGRMNAEFGPSQFRRSAGSSQKTPPLQLQNRSPPCHPPSLRLVPEAPSFAIATPPDKGLPAGERGLWREQMSGCTRKWPFVSASQASSCPTCRRQLLHSHPN